MKTTYFLASLAAAAVAAAPATAASLNSGTANVPKYISDNGEGSLKITHTWASKAKLPRRRSDMSATTVGDAVYLVGGCTQDQGYAEFGGDNSTWGMYVCNDITTNTTAYFPSNDSHVVLPEAPHPRYRHAAAAVGDKIFVYGGCDVTDALVTAVDVFDVPTRSWSTLPNAFSQATSDNAGFVLGTKIYSVGGYGRPWDNTETKSKTWVLDVGASGASATTASWTEAGELTEKRGDLGVVVTGGKAIAFGGFTHVNAYSMPLKTVEAYDATSQTWTPTTSLAQTRGDKAGAALNGRVFVVGGETRGSNGEVLPLTDVETFNPLTKKWSKAGDIPTHRFRFTAASVGSSLFVFGGQGYLVGTANQLGSYYPVTDAVEKFEETVDIVPTTNINLNVLYIAVAVILIGVAVAYVLNQGGAKSNKGGNGADVAQKV